MAVPKKGDSIVKPSSKHGDIRKTLLNWRSIKIQKQRENNPLQTKRAKDQIDFNSKETAEDLNVKGKNQSGLSMKTSQRAKTQEAEEGTRKTLQQKRMREIQKLREIARLKINQMKNTAGLNDNMEAEREFYEIIGCESYPVLFN